MKKREEVNQSLPQSRPFKSSKSVSGYFFVDLSGKLSVDLKGRPSGQIDGTHGDHVTAQILPSHGIRRAANGIVVSEIDDLRSVRRSIFDFITSIGILNEDLSNTEAKVDGVSETDYRVNYGALNSLYLAVDETLDYYNQKRYKNSALHILEKTFDTALKNIPALNLNDKDNDIIEGYGGLETFYQTHLNQIKDSNSLLICETFTRLIELISTYYYKIPNTAYRRIEGYEAPDSEGPYVSTTLSKLDEICERLNKGTEMNSRGIRRRNTAVRTLSKTVIDFFANSNRNSKYEEEIFSKLASFGDDPDRGLKCIAFMIKYLFYYPEAPASSVGNQKNDRNNEPEEFYKQVSRHLFIVFNVYPELIKDVDNKEKIVKFFLNELIFGELGWQSISSTDIEHHVLKVNSRLACLYKAQCDNLYTNRDEYRQRASSATLEQINNDIIETTMSYISDNFGLEEERLQGLESALREMSLGKGDMIFSDDAMKYIKIYCLHDDVEKEKMLELENILLPNHIIKTEERGRK